MKVTFFFKCSSSHGDASKNYNIRIIQFSDQYLYIIPTIADSVLHFSDTVQVMYLCINIKLLLYLMTNWKSNVFYS